MHGTLPRPRFTFDWLIAPVGRAAFLADHYERTPLILHRRNPGYYRDLLALDDVWDHIEARCPGPGEINMIKFASGGCADEWMGDNRRADPVRIAQLFTGGWTIGLNRMHEHLPALAELCTAAEAVFSCPFQANLYLTPPGAQGFTAHWDTHDVFVLQVHGSKDWTLYDTQIELPLVGQSFDDHKPAPGPATASFTLRAGDLLYCPRGLMHSAQSGPETSLHITFGLMGRTWSELVMEAVSKVFLADPALRRNLPAGFANPGFDADTAAAEFAGLMQRVAAQAEFGPALAMMRDRFMAGQVPRRPGQAQQLAGLGQLTPASRAAARPDLVWQLEAHEDQVSLACGPTVLTLPGFTADAVRAALGSASFTVGDLPGPLDEDGKVALTRRLIRDGLVQAL